MALTFIAVWQYPIVMKSGGEFIREARRRAGLTQQELAERLSTTQSVIARWETGRRSPTVETLYRAVRACGLDVHITLGAPDPDHDFFIRENRRLEPSQRLDHLTDHVAGVRDLLDARDEAADRSLRRR